MHAEREVMSSIIVLFNNFVKYFTSKNFILKNTKNTLLNWESLCIQSLHFRNPILTRLI